MLWEVLMIVIIIWVAQRRWLMRRQIAFAKQLKTNVKTYPILGHAYTLLGSDEDRMAAFHRFGRDAIELGGISKCIHFNYLFICVADPVVVEVLLTKCLEKHSIFKMVDYVIGNASPIAPVHTWRLRRKMNAPVFSTKHLAQFFEVFVRESNALVNSLEKEADKGTFSIWKYISTQSMNTVCENTMGVKIDAKTRELTDVIEEMWEFGASILCQPWKRNILPLLPNYSKMCQNKIALWNFITQIIQEKKNQINVKTNQTGVSEANPVVSFLDLQLKPSENVNKYTERGLFEESLSLVGAGYDTAATSAAFTIVMISRYPDIQDKIYKELQNVFGDSNRLVTFEDIPKLKYLDAVIKETLRLYPTAPIIARQADEDVVLPSGMTVVKGCGILINIWAVHRNPKYWGEDADQFRPERFLDYTPKHPAAFMAFSYGARGCIGYRYAMISLKTVLSTMLRRYRLLAPPGVPQGEPLRTKFSVLLKHVDNYEIRLERRRNL